MRIFLLGFMGSGKSHWGKLWADAHDMLYVDLDRQIERQEQTSIATIFDNTGEEYFRIREAAILREQVKNQHCIIACGGGSPCFFDNMKWMNENGITVFLEATPPFLVKNVLDEKEKRPLIRDLNEAEILFFIEQKLKERNPFYQEAQHVINAETADLDSLQGIISTKI